MDAASERRSYSDSNTSQVCSGSQLDAKFSQQTVTPNRGSVLAAAIFVHTTTHNDPKQLGDLLGRLRVKETFARRAIDLQC